VALQADRREQDYLTYTGGAMHFPKDSNSNVAFLKVKQCTYEKCIDINTNYIGFGFGCPPA
jgi:hypothetical protein